MWKYYTLTQDSFELCQERIWVGAFLQHPSKRLISLWRSAGVKELTDTWISSSGHHGIIPAWKERDSPYVDSCFWDQLSVLKLFSFVCDVSVPPACQFSPLVIYLSHARGVAQWMATSVSRPTALIQNEISQKLLDGLLWNLAQTFALPSRWVVITLVIWHHHQIKLSICSTLPFMTNYWHLLEC